jgi:hypothetical protein
MNSRPQLERATSKAVAAAVGATLVMYALHGRRVASVLRVHLQQARIAQAIQNLTMK